MGIRDLAAGGAKVMRRAGAVVTGDPAIVARLKGEHAEVSTLMASILAKKESTDVADVRERQRIFEVIREKLLAHAKAEEAVVYPTVRTADGRTLQNEVAHSYDDHLRIEALLETLHMSDAGSLAWVTTFHELHDIVASHVREEENVLLPRARESLSPEQLKQMDERYQQTEAEIKQQVSATHATQPIR